MGAEMYVDEAQQLPRLRRLIFRKEHEGHYLAGQPKVGKLSASQTAGMHVSREVQLSIMGHDIVAAPERHDWLELRMAES